MAKVSLVRVGGLAGGEDVEAELKKGINWVGRHPDYKVGDKRVSRSQLKVEVLEDEDEDDGKKVKVFVTANGVNPSMWKKKGGSGFEELEKGRKQRLNDGDIIALLMEEYLFRVNIEPVAPSKDTKNPKTDSRNVAKSSMSSMSSNNAQKRALDNVEGPKGLKKRKESSDDENSDEDTTKQYKHKQKQVEDDVNSEEEKITLCEMDEKVSLAFTSISTSTFKFDAKKAIPILCDAVMAFLGEHKDPSLRLVLLDTPGSSLLPHVKNYYNKHCDDQRFVIREGDITLLKSKSKLPCNFIANSVNWRFHPGGSGVNKAINDAAGSCLHKLTKSLYTQTANVGVAYPVELPATSPLRKNENVHWVIHILGPNMNPERPNCLNGDYELGSSKKKSLEILAIFTKYLASSGNAFDAIMTQAKYAQSQKSEPKKLKSPASSPTPSPPKGGWQNGLISYIRNPENNSDSVYFYDEDLVVIYDKFPKAKYHFLIMPRQEISDIWQFSNKDVPMLDLLEARANKIVSDIKKKDPHRNFKIGFHAVPSMRQVHLHVISTDFNSEALKVKKHWNSFTTDFFLPISKVKRILSEHKELKLPYSKREYEAMLKDTMKCNRCHQECNTMPILKRHIAECNG